MEKLIKSRFISIFFILSLLLCLNSLPTDSVRAASTITFTAEELLTRPTDTSVNINIIPAEAISLYYEYGTLSGGPYSSTSTVSAAAAAPCNVVLTGLAPDTKYYYRMQYQKPGDIWVTRAEHSFHTQRAPGDTFTFVVTSDTHAGLGGNFFSAARYNQTLANILADQPDFWIDAGDTPPDDFMHSLTEYQNGYKTFRSDIKAISGNVPFFQVLGNHEQEMGWNLDDNADPNQTQPIQAVNARRAIIPNPKPDSFYSGNLDTSLTYIDDDHLREDYYAFTWGDALFIALDPYWYTMKFPQENSTYPFGGEENQSGEEATKGTRWDWSLGIQQYLWLKNTLANSTAPYKFVFIHNVTGGIIPYGRGGTEIAGYFEWGGKNWDDTWGFDSHRSAAAGWTTPIHQLMDQYNVTIFFHGHDHFYAKQELDGIVYQEIPMPAAVDAFTGFMNEQTGTYASQYPDPARILFYNGATKYVDSGHLRVTVSPAEVKVDYVRMNGSITDSYTIAPSTTQKVRDDYDGDGKTDAVKFDPAAGIGWWLKSSTGLWDGKWLGSDSFDYVSASDFDGDGQTDPAKFYSGTGTVWWVKSSTGTLDGQWLGPDLFTYITGSDFDGDGKADPAKFYPGTGTVWWVKSTTGLLDGQWLGPDTFTYVSGSDFDGDGKSDPAKFYPATGTLWWVKSTTGVLDGKWLGPDTFTYVPASDFDGDGRTDPAKFYSGTGNVWWVKSSTGVMDGAWMGSGTFTYVPGCDFNGDGRTDPAKYDAGTHTLSWLNVGTGTWTDIDTQSGTYTLANGQ